jgi:hypothetical protein
MSETVAAVESRLELLRENARYHWVALVVASVVGLGLGSLHWVGLVVAGALVGLTARSLRRALLGGFAFGVLVVLVWLATFAIEGSLGAVLAMGTLALPGFAIGLLAPAFGSLARGIV